jgi:hypothetical protein
MYLVHHYWTGHCEGQKLDQLAVEITDPAKELATLGQALLNAGGGNNTVAGIARSIGISADDAEFLDVLAAIQRRIKDVEALVGTATDPDFDDELKNEVLNATRGFLQLLHPQHAHEPWEQARTRFLPAKSITALRFFSQTARRRRPLRVVPETARKAAMQKIVEAIEEVSKDENLEDWMKPVLVSGLQRVHLVLTHFRFFGHEAAIVELFLAHQKLSVSCQAVEEGESQAQSFWQVVVVLSLVGNLFILPDQVVTAFDRYKSWSNDLLRVITAPKIPPAQRLLLAPVAIVDKREEEPNS